MFKQDASLFDFNILDNENKDNDFIPEGYLRVTDCLKPFNKFDMIDPVVLANAAERGSRVHKFCEMYVNNMLFEEVDEDCANYVNAFKLWYDANVVKLLYSEKRVNSKSRMLSGAFDLLVMLKSSPCPVLIDIKTPQKESLSWALQMAAYRLLVKEELDLSGVDRMALILPKTSKKVKEIRYENHSKDTELYINALELYRYFNPIKQSHDLF